MEKVTLFFFFFCLWVQTTSRNFARFQSRPGETTSLYTKAMRVGCASMWVEYHKDKWLKPLWMSKLLTLCMNWSHIAYEQPGWRNYLFAYQIDKLCQWYIIHVMEYAILLIKTNNILMWLRWAKVRITIPTSATMRLRKLKWEKCYLNNGCP